QDLGHQAVLIIGDFTALVGDPSAARPRARGSPGPKSTCMRAPIRSRSSRSSVPPAPSFIATRRGPPRPTREDVVRLRAKTTVARMLERDDFRQRHAVGNPIGLHEFLYPLMQGYDSVAVRADVELGGTDQTFNLLGGRDLQRDAGQPGQVAPVLPLLGGRDGVKKMSKSLGNHIGIAEPPEEMYGKVMSIGDALMVRYAELLGVVPEEQLALIREGRVHPMEAKKALSRDLVTRFHGKSA